MNRILRTHARDLRRHSTDAERTLWYALRDRRLGGARFRRQKPIGSRIVDFYSAEARLVIELDGGGHADDVTVADDGRRTRELEAHGLRVLRFWNTDVLQNLDGVLATIVEALKSRTSP